MNATISQAPMSDEALERYANKWVTVRGGEVIVSADDYDTLMADNSVQPTDAVYHVPPADSLFY